MKIRVTLRGLEVYLTIVPGSSGSHQPLVQELVLGQLGGQLFHQKTVVAESPHRRGSLRRLAAPWLCLRRRSSAFCLGVVRRSP